MTEAVQFVVNNWMLVLVAAVSGAMLLWPLIQRRLSPVREIGVQGATQLINRNDALIVRFAGRPLIAYCERGNRSRTAAAALTKLGFSEIFVLHGGLRAWADAGMPLEKG